jgi:hypothetical protein
VSGARSMTRTTSSSISASTTNPPQKRSYRRCGRGSGQYRAIARLSQALRPPDFSPPLSPARRPEQGAEGLRVKGKWGYSPVVRADRLGLIRKVEMFAVSGWAMDARLLERQAEMLPALVVGVTPDCRAEGRRLIVGHNRRLQRPPYVCMLAPGTIR